jgi:ribosome-associated protein
MKPEELKVRNFENECVFSASRSGGAGGQNVNKVSTKVELRINILTSDILTSEEKIRIREKLKNRINKEGELVISSQSERTQLMNKIKVINKFYILVSKALTQSPYRKVTRPSLSSKMERLDNKKKRGSIKKLRNNSDKILNE